MNSPSELKQHGGDTYRVSFVCTVDGTFQTLPSSTYGKVIKVEMVGVSLIEGSNLVEVGWYDSANELPQWMQEKLAVLMILKKEGFGTDMVPGVGRRISGDIFWVYSDEN